MDDSLCYGNATHELECRHAIGPHGKTYYMRCHVLKVMPGRRLKLRVYGDRYWADRHDVVRIRYVPAWRVRKRG